LTIAVEHTSAAIPIEPKRSAARLVEPSFRPALARSRDNGLAFPSNGMVWKRLSAAYAAAVDGMGSHGGADRIGEVRLWQRLMAWSPHRMVARTAWLRASAISGRRQVSATLNRAPAGLGDRVCGSS